MAAPSARLFGDGVPGEVLARIAARYGMEHAASGCLPADRSLKNIVLLGAVHQDHILPWLSSPADAYIELITEDSPISDEVLENLNSGKLCFSFATSTAYLTDYAALVCEALAARGILTPMRRPDVELSVHETISNAVVHGNLALASNMKGDVQHFSEFAQALQNRMTAPEAKKRVDITAQWDHEFLDITVADQGKGYDESKLPANLDPFAPAGRGLSIIRSLTLSMNVTHGGRMTTLRFLT